MTYYNGCHRKLHRYNGCRCNRNHCCEKPKKNYAPYWIVVLALFLIGIAALVLFNTLKAKGGIFIVCNCVITVVSLICITVLCVNLLRAQHEKEDRHANCCLERAYLKGAQNQLENKKQGTQKDDGTKGE